MHTVATDADHHHDDHRVVGDPLERFSVHQLARGAAVMFGDEPATWVPDGA